MKDFAELDEFFHGVKAGRKGFNVGEMNAEFYRQLPPDEQKREDYGAFFRHISHPKRGIILKEKHPERFQYLLDNNCPFLYWHELGEERANRPFNVEVHALTKSILRLAGIHENSVKEIVGKIWETVRDNKAPLFVTGEGRTGLVGKIFVDNMKAMGYDARFMESVDLGVLVDGAVVIGASGSGTTKQVLERLEKAKRKGAYCFGVTTTPGSEICNAEYTDSCLCLPPQTDFEKGEFYDAYVGTKLMKGSKPFRPMGTESETKTNVTFKSIVKCTEHLKDGGEISDVPRVFCDSVRSIADRARKLQDLDYGKVSDLANKIVGSSGIRRGEVLVTGKGESKHMAKAFAMRLMHCGIGSHYFGDATRQNMSEGDAVLAIYGPRDSDETVTDIRTANRIGRPVFAFGNEEWHITNDVCGPQNVIYIPHADIEDWYTTTSIALDGMIAEIAAIMGVTEAYFRRRHV